MRDDEQHRSQRETTLAALERMVKAGWLKQTARAGDFASIEFTEDGEIARRLFKRFLMTNGGRITTAELQAFIRIIDSTPELLP